MTVHVTPMNDVVEHEESDECWCGPDVDYSNAEPIVVHHSIDGREMKESTQ